jgi:hypothetical protein
MIALIAAVLAADYAPFPKTQALEPVYGFAADDRGVTVLFGSCGASKPDFRAIVSRSGDRPTVRIVRRGGVSFGVACTRVNSRGPWSSPSATPNRGPVRSAITWSYEELGLQPGQRIDLANPSAGKEGGVQ